MHFGVKKGFSSSLCLTETKSTNGWSKQQIGQVNYLEASTTSNQQLIKHDSHLLNWGFAHQFSPFLNTTSPFSYMRYLVLGINDLMALECATSMRTGIIKLSTEAIIVTVTNAFRCQKVQQKFMSDRNQIKQWLSTNQAGKLFGGRSLFLLRD